MKSFVELSESNFAVEHSDIHDLIQQTCITVEKSAVNHTQNRDKYVLQNEAYYDRYITTVPKELTPKISQILVR